MQNIFMSNAIFIYLNYFIIQVPGGLQDTILNYFRVPYPKTPNPCFCTIESSLSAMPLGRLAPVSHFSTVLSLVLR